MDSTLNLSLHFVRKSNEIKYDSKLKLIKEGLLTFQGKHKSNHTKKKHHHPQMGFDKSGLAGPH